MSKRKDDLPALIEQAKGGNRDALIRVVRLAEGNDPEALAGVRELFNPAQWAVYGDVGP